MRLQRLTIIILIVLLVGGAGAVFLYSQQMVETVTAAFENISVASSSSVFFSFPYTQQSESPLAHAARRTVSSFPLLPETPPPFVDARAFAVIDARSGRVLGGNNIETVVPIASLTKLMTTLVVLDMRPDFDTAVPIVPADDLPGGRIVLRRGEKVRIGDLFAASLLASSNNATMALARSTGLSQEEFVQKMNEKALELHLLDTTFSEPTGLDAGNTSTVLDLARLSAHALFASEIGNLVTKSDHVFFAVPTGRRIRVASTDALLWRSDLAYTILGGKTGYTEEAGYSFVLAAENEHGRGLLTLVLGSEHADSRFAIADTLTRWAFALP